MNGNQLREKLRFISHPVVFFSGKSVIIRPPIKWLFVEFPLLINFRQTLSRLFSAHLRPFAFISGASPLFAKPEMGSVRFRVHKMRRRPWPSAARVRPGAHSARHQDSRNDWTPSWLGLSSSPALTRRNPTKRPTLRLRGGRRSPLVAYAPSLSWAPPRQKRKYRVKPKGEHSLPSGQPSLWSAEPLFPSFAAPFQKSRAQ